MSKTSKSPKRVLKVAYEVGNEVLPKRWHRFSPKTYSPAQLFACLVLKAFFRCDYREIEEILHDCPEFCATIELGKVPTYSTLCKAEKRLLNEDTSCKLLRETIAKALSRRQMKELVELAAIDGSGFESRHISEHFRKRQNYSGKVVPHKKYPKLSLVVDTATHMILAAETGRGPKPDIGDFKKLLSGANDTAKIKCVVADAGYDAEHSHEFARDVLGILSFIPPLIGKQTSKLPTGYYRRLMRTSFDTMRYRQRWQVETVFSMLKRLLRSALTARNSISQSRELYLRVITLNIMILKYFFRR